MNHAQTTTAAMPTTAVLLAEYNTLSYNSPESKAVMEYRAAEISAQILNGDLSGKLPAKADKLCAGDVTGELFPRPILAPKPGKLTPLQAAAEFVSTDTLRPAMCGVYHHTYANYGKPCAAAVGTTGHVLGVFPTEAPAENVILNPKTLAPFQLGEKIGAGKLADLATAEGVTDRYPDYQNCIPTAGKTNPAYIITDIQALRNILAGILRACAFIDCKVGGLLALIRHNGESYYFQPAFLALTLRTLQATGTTRVQLELSTPNRAAVLRDMDNPEKMVLVMPIMYGVTVWGPDTRPYALLLDTATPQAAPTAPAPRKRTVKATSPAAPLPFVLAYDHHETGAAMEYQGFTNLVAAETAAANMRAETKTASYCPHPRAMSRADFEAAELADYAATLAWNGTDWVAPATSPVEAPAPVEAPLFDNVTGIAGFSDAMFQASAAHRAEVDAMPKLKRGQRVETFLDGAGGVLSRTGRDYWVKLDSGERELYGRGDLTPMQDEAHQIGQPITHAPTIAALAELVTLATAQMEREALTSPAPTEQPAEQCPVALTHNGVTVYHIRKYGDDATSRILNYHFSLSPDGANEFDVRELPGYVEPEYDSDAPMGQFHKQQQAEGQRVLRLHVAGPAPTSPAESETVTTTIYLDHYRTFFGGQSASTAYSIEAPVSVARLAEYEAACALHPHTSLHELTALIMQAPTAPSADTTALLVEHQAAEYLRTCNDDEPDELISARHGEPATFAPVAELTPPRMSKRKFPFTALRLAGHRVTVLHQMGKCAVARVYPCEGRAPYYAARFRQHTVQFGHLREAGQALLTLRRMDNAEIRRDNEVLTATDALDQLGLDPACFARFCTLHELDVGRSYMRRELRRAITDRRQPKMPVYLSLLNRLTVTSPAA